MMHVVNNSKMSKLKKVMERKDAILKALKRSSDNMVFGSCGVVVLIFQAGAVPGSPRGR